MHCCTLGCWNKYVQLAPTETRGDLMQMSGSDIYRLSGVLSGVLLKACCRKKLHICNTSIRLLAIRNFNEVCE